MKMHSTITTIVLRVLIATATIVAVAVIMFPSHAQAAPCAEPGCTMPQLPLVKAPVASSYDRNWAQVFGRADCPTGAMCLIAGEPRVTAWRWTGSQWNRSFLYRDEWVWVRTFSGEWSWAWTQRTGYVAIRTERLYVWDRRDCFNALWGSQPCR